MTQNEVVQRLKDVHPWPDNDQFVPEIIRACLEAYATAVLSRYRHLISEAQCNAATTVDSEIRRKKL